MRLALLSLLVLAAPDAPAARAADAAPKGGAGTTWYRMVAEGGAVVGHSSLEVKPGKEGRETVLVQEMLLANEGAPTRIREITTTREDREGRIVSIAEHVQVGRSWSRTEARMAHSEATVVRTTPSGRTSSKVKLPEAVRFDSGAALLRSWNPARTPRLEFDNFSLGAAAVERVVIERLDGAAAGAAFQALRTRYLGGSLTGVARLAISADGRIEAVTQPMLGASVTIRATDRETALRAHPPFRHVTSAMIKSPHRIPPAAMRGRIRYRFGFRDGLTFPLPQTSEQRTETGAGTVTLDICADCGPGLPTDPAFLATARRATPWLQSDHPKLRAFARPTAALKVSDARKMELLLERARPYLGQIDFAGHFSALETLSRRAGDCTEAAVLLAALGRAAGIPTKVANGLVYSRERYHGVSNAFMPHSWTLAYVDGAWRSFDLALDTFDSTHIAVNVGDGDARSVAAAGQLGSLLEWQSMTEVRSRGGR